MRRARGCAVAVLLILVPPLSGEVPVPKPGGVMLELFPEGDVEPPPEAESDAAALPEPSLEEPFAIGEALYDPEGVPLAVVSLLDLMGVPIVADQAAADRAGRLTLSEAEVLELIDQGVEDATAAAESDDGSPPHTFADLHAWIAPFLNGIDAAGLAARYARAYERRPDDLVPAVLMGQPIEPETPLTRVQIWLLLVDGFVGPGERTGTAALDGRGDGGRPAYAVLRGARPSPAIPVAGRNTSWGTALPGTQNVIGRLLDIADFPWVTAHLPMLQSRVPFTISPGSAVAHEGHGGNGQRVVFEASIGPAAGPITAPSGRPVLVPRPSASVAGVPIRWVPSQEDEETFEAHGTFQAALFTAMPTDAAGKVRLPYVPKRENANGVGRLRRERATMKASVKVRDLVFSRYELAPEFASFRPQLESGGYRATRSPARIEWHSDGLELELTSQFDVALDLQALGKTHRWGFEGVRGSLARISDGLYRGRVLARTSPSAPSGSKRPRGRSPG
jgi:hypothetical protein